MDSAVAERDSERAPQEAAPDPVPQATVSPEDPSPPPIPVNMPISNPVKPGTFFDVILRALSSHSWSGWSHAFEYFR